MFNILKLTFQITKKERNYKRRRIIQCGLSKNLVIELSENDVFLMCKNGYKLKL